MDGEFVKLIDDVEYFVEYKFDWHGDDCELDEMVVYVGDHDVTDKISKSIDDMLVEECYRRQADCCSPKEILEPEDC